MLFTLVAAQQSNSLQGFFHLRMAQKIKTTWDDGIPREISSFSITNIEMIWATEHDRKCVKKKEAKVAVLELISIYKMFP